MPIQDGRVCVTVKCPCGTETEISSGTYGSYCTHCARPIFSSKHTEELNAEIRKVVHSERLKIRKSKKDKTFIKDDFSVGGSSVISTCYTCGSPLNAGAIFVVDGETVCKNCYETRTPKCKGCNTKHFAQYLKGGLCEGCLESFRTCNNCGYTYDIRKYREIHAGDRVWCPSCVRTYLNSIGVCFQSYSHKPRPTFFGDREVGYYYGVENEMDNSERRDEFMALAHTEEVYFKSDGSLGCDGVEVVTHPATLDYHMTELPWKRILSSAKKCGFRSHTGSSGRGSSANPTCGLHIHVSKSAFGRTTEERDKREAKLLLLFDKFWPQLVIFSRRDKRSLETWARRYATFDVSQDQLSTIITKAKHENSGTRRLAVNFSANGGTTVEFRLFRGTLNYETLIASIQLIDQLIESTKLSTEKVQALTWEAFCDQSCKYTEFSGYIARLRDMKRKI